MIEHIFVDMDGVLADFVGGALRLFGKSELLETWPKGVWEVEKVLQIDPHEFWTCIEKAPNFWEALHPYPWMNELLHLCEKAAPVSILTSPARDPNCVAGKMKWIKRWCPDFLRRTCIWPEKYLLARPTYLLIDDSDKNCDKWRDFGGGTYLWPQPWNPFHALQWKRVQSLAGILRFHKEDRELAEEWDEKNPSAFQP